MLRNAAAVLASLICIGYIAIPIGVMTGFVGGNLP